jgi:WD40 repeat protein
MQAHSDWVNALETDKQKKELYSCSKDGVVKVWRMKQKKLKCMAALAGGGGSVNCITAID